ncbi:hypothetical protein Lal_00033359 [Lupinus albus]|nr:hypothetical protein Lal_00033359 [Lupinus albus]
MYDWVMTSIGTRDETLEDFSIVIRLHQGFTLNSYLFNLVLDVLTKHFLELLSQCAGRLERGIKREARNVEISYRIT